MNKARIMPRLAGLDFARFLAFVGMVFVNFKIAMGVPDDDSVLGLITQALEGRAAACFVVLAGIGMGLSSLRNDGKQTIDVTVKRAGFLLVLGLLNSLIFNADILHYYAFYFLFGVLLLELRSRWLIAGMVLLNVSFVSMVFAFDFDSGWNWTDLSYADFWTPTGFVRNLFFNGFHPVVPWLGFLLFGILLSRTALHEQKTQRRLMLFGVATYTAVEVLGLVLSNSLHGVAPELDTLVTTKPIPPMPLYIMAGLGAASFVIGLSLRLAGWFDRVGLLTLVTPAGRQTLTLYIAHVLIGMGTLEALGRLDNQTRPEAITAATLFCLVAVVYAYLWSLFFKRGPIEAAMRRIAG
jgi:uncharacterized protein